MLSYEEFQKQRQTGKSIEQIAAESFSRVKTGANQPQTSSTQGGAMLSYEEFQKQRQAGKSIEQIAAESFSRVKTGTNQPQTSSMPGGTAMLSYEEFQKQRQTGKSIEQIVDESFSRVKTGTNQPQTSLKQSRTTPYGRKTSAAVNAMDAAASSGKAPSQWAYTQQQIKDSKNRLSQIDAEAGYATTVEQADKIQARRKAERERLAALEEQAAALNRVGGGSGRGGSGQKTDWWKVAAGVVEQGAGQVAKAGSSTLDWLFGGFLQELQTLAGVTAQGLGAEKAGTFLIENDNPITALNKGVSADLAKMQEYYAKNAQGNKAAEFVNKYGPSVVAAIPNAALAYYTAGASAEAQATTAGLQAISSAQNLNGIYQVANTIYRAAAAMAKDPQAQLAFVQMAGPSYEEALADGASESEATVYALLNGGFGAAVEVGGGLQTLPRYVTEALAKGDMAVVLAYAKSIVEEIGEEEIQGLFGRWLKTTYGKDTKVYSNDPEQNAILKPDEMREEATGAALVSAILGAPGTISQVNAAHKTRGKTTAEPAAVTETAMSAADGGAQGTRAISETAPVETGAKRTETNPAGEMEAANKGRPVPGENKQTQSAEGQQTAAQAESPPPNNASRNRESTAVNTDPEQHTAAEQQASLPNSPERGKVKTEGQNIPQWWELTEQQQEAITRTIENRVAQLAGKDRAELLDRHFDYDLPEQIYNDYTHGQESLNYWSQWFGDATRLAADLDSGLTAPASNTQKKELLDNTKEQGTIIIGRSLGAKAKNYDIELPNKEIVHLTEGSRITHTETIAGDGRYRQIDEIDLLVERWGGSELKWQKKKGIGYIDYNGESYRVELHWYEEPTAGRHKWKVKPDANGNWFIEE